ncbi:hypothetical protein QEN19_000847 [Hanseniaspora menglaensis]
MGCTEISCYKTLPLNSGKLDITAEQLAFWNVQLEKLDSPESIIKWALTTFEHIYQISALGLSGLAIIDLLNEKFSSYKVDCIFIDTLHHFPQTLDLVEKVKSRYYANKNVSKFHIVTPKDVNDENSFAKKHGQNLWETDDDKYDYFSKVEPLERTYKAFEIDIVITGRRQSQGNNRSNLSILEYDETNKVLKLNPFYNFTFNQIYEIIEKNDVPTNELLEFGYKSIGDYHSTLPTNSDDDERGGRWADKKGKTECGIHQPERFAKYK